MDVSQKQVRVMILVFVIINTFLLASMKFLPFIDIPNHLAEATIFKYYESGNLLSQYYKPTPWYFPNTFHTVFCSLFPSVEWGNRIFHILYLALLQVSVFLVIRQLNGNAWYGLLATLFTYNYNVTFGFVGFVISIPALIFLFYLILRYAETEDWYLNILIALVLVLLFFMHAQNALMGCVIYGVMMLYHYRTSFKRLVAHVLLIPLPLIILIFTWWFTRESARNEESTFAYLKEYYTTSYFQDFFTRFRIVVFDNFQLQEGIPGLAIATCFFLCTVIPVLVSRPWKRSPSRVVFSSNKVYAGIFFLITLSCYVLVPDKLPGQTPIFQRFCTIVILSFIILASIFLQETNYKWLRNFVIASVTVYTLLWCEYIYSFNRQNKDFNEALFAGLDPTKTLVGLIYDNQYRGRKVYIHFPNYRLVWNRGITASKIIDYRFGVVRRVTTGEPLPFYEELIAENFSYQQQYMTVGYLLVRGTAPVTQDPHLRNFILGKQSGPWKLYQNEKLK